MEIHVKDVLRPNDQELRLLERINKLYEDGNYGEFEKTVLGLLDSDRLTGGASKFENMRNNVYYALKPGEVSEDAHSMIRRLGTASPADPLNFSTSEGRRGHAQLVEKSDFERLIKAIAEMLAKIFGLKKDTQARAVDLDDDDFAPR